MLPVLTADDFAITEAVSGAIAELARARRLSATSAMVTFPEWPALAPMLRDLRGEIAVGLHLNLTVGDAPASATLAPGGQLQTINRVIALCTTGRLAAAEVRAEVSRQLDLYERHAGAAPDHIDGHQHVHAFPIVRDAIIAEAARRYPSCPPLIRVPYAPAMRMLTRGATGVKGLVVGTLASGFAAACRRAGLPVNTAFAGFSSFDRRAAFGPEIRAEIAAANDAGGLAIVMCHPGRACEILPLRDGIVGRRADELEALATLPDLPDLIAHPVRTAEGCIDWQAAGAIR